jgi:hypothetical protein
MNDNFELGILIDAGPIPQTLHLSELIEAGPLVAV